MLIIIHDYVNTVDKTQVLDALNKHFDILINRDW